MKKKMAVIFLMATFLFSETVINYSEKESKTVKYENIENAVKQEDIVLETKKTEKEENKQDKVEVKRERYNSYEYYGKPDKYENKKENEESILDFAAKLGLLLLFKKMGL